MLYIPMLLFFFFGCFSFRHRLDVPPNNDRHLSNERILVVFLGRV